MLKRNLIGNFLGQGWTALMGLAFIPLYIRYLGMEAYGLIGLFALMQTWLALLDLGMSPTLNREMARHESGVSSPQELRDLLRSLEIVALLIALLIAAGVYLASGWLASNWVHSTGASIGEVSVAISSMGIVLALKLLEGIYRGSIVGLQRQVTFNLISASMATVRSVGAVAVIALVSPTIFAFFVWQGVVSLATLLILVVATYHHLPAGDSVAKFSIAALRRVGKFTGGMVGISAMSLILTQFDKVLLSKLLSLSEYGHYALAAVLASALNLLVAPITQAWFPRLSQLHASKQEAQLTETFHLGAQLVAVLMGSAAVVLIVFSDTFLRLWLQDASVTSRSADLLRVLVLGTLLNGLMWIPYQAQLAAGRTGLMVRINAVAICVYVPATLWATPHFGARGAAWMWVALNAGYLLIGAHYMFRIILPGEKRRWYIQDVIFPIGGATAAAVAVLAAVPTGSTHDLALLMVASSSALCASLLSAPLVRRRAVGILGRAKTACRSIVRLYLRAFLMKRP